MAIDTETKPAPACVPAWASFRHYISNTDRLVHRVIDLRRLGLMLYDEVGVVVTPFTKCGLPLEQYEDVAVPESVGFCTEEVTLTCVACASGRVLDGDRERQRQKNDLFGFMYGKTVNNIPHITPKPPGTYVSGRGTYKFTTRRVGPRFRWLRGALWRATQRA